MRAIHIRLALSAALTAALLLALHATAIPAGIDVRNCERCGRFWDDSPSHMRLTLDYDGHGKDYYLCSPFCTLEELERHPTGELAGLYIVDYSQKDELVPIMLVADHAFFLYGVKGDKADAREPWVAAFQSEKYAKEAKAALGGVLLKWEDVRKKVAKLTDEYEAPGPRQYERLKRRD
jgi:hypothetical protein